MVEEFVGAYGSRLVIAVVGVGIGLVCLIGVLWLLRGRGGPSPFVRGGRNRNPRLQVLDAAAVDTRRRLVLVRRDDVEHLIMIGGPTDIVIESRIQPADSQTGIAQPIGGYVPSEPSLAAIADGADRTRQRPLPEPRAEIARPDMARAEIARPEITRQDVTRPEPVRSEPLRELPVQAVRPAAEPIVQPSAPPVVSAAAPTVMPMRSEPVAVAIPVSPPLAGLVRAEAAPRPIADLSRPAPVAPAQPAQEPSPAMDDAANALEAARGRVLAEQPPKVVAINMTPAPLAAPAPAGQPKGLGSDFEKILEEEMAQNLAAREAAAPRPAPTAGPIRQTPPRNPAVPPITGATSDPSLQDEVARIFGEMSASRDK